MSVRASVLHLRPSLDQTFAPRSSFGKSTVGPTSNANMFRPGYAAYAIVRGTTQTSKRCCCCATIVMVPDRLRKCILQGPDLLDNVVELLWSRGVGRVQNMLELAGMFAVCAGRDPTQNSFDWQLSGRGVVRPCGFAHRPRRKMLRQSLSHQRGQFDQHGAPSPRREAGIPRSPRTRPP